MFWMMRNILPASNVLEATLQFTSVEMIKHQVLPSYLKEEDDDEKGLNHFILRQSRVNAVHCEMKFYVEMANENA